MLEDFLGVALLAGLGEPGNSAAYRETGGMGGQRSSPQHTSTHRYSVLKDPCSLCTRRQTSTASLPKHQQ